MTTRTQTFGACALLSLALAAACGDDSGSPASGVDEDAAVAVAVGDDQTPPTDGAAIEAWLKGGAYKAWACEPEVHAGRDPSPHGFNRICSNELIAGAVEGKSPWPKGAAGVKELYAALDATTPIGYAVYLKTADDSAAGANWYWYERVGDDVIADGLGDSGAAKSTCVGCHIASGADADHTPTPGGRDQVYTPVSE